MVELAAGAVIADKLRLLRPLGQGGMGVVWAARHLALETDVAVKLIRPERIAADPALVARFEREAKTTARIAHPHVVRVMDYGAIDGAVPYIVMELLSGFSLAELLDSGGRLSLATAKALVEQVGGALESAHERGVVHRDIKPHNVFIMEERQGLPLFVKVLDFGVAKMLGDAQVPGGGALTETGTIIGSPPYMSPEQIEGRKDVDLRSDLWSLGVIVYESLTGRRPFSGSSFVAVGSAVIEGKFQPAAELRKGLPAWVDDWLAKALAVDPDSRFQSAREMVLAFDGHDEPAELGPAPSAPQALAYATTLDAKPPVETAAPLPPKAHPKRRRAVAIATFAGIAVIGAVALAGRAKLGAAAGCPAGMIPIDGATFRMGSAAEGETPSDETPLHDVTLSAFCLDATEVTMSAYAACASCDPLPGKVEGEGLTPNAIAFWSQFCNRNDAREHPANCVDWQRANAYCEATGKRLPTEAEWELAARGEERRAHPWGDAPPTSAHLNACGAECSKMLTERLAKQGGNPWPQMHEADDGAPATSPVGRHSAGATPAGVLDLAGNVWEWTSSAYCRYGEECSDSRRVIRGGGWDTVESREVRAARRLPSAPSVRSWSVGFRCAKSL